MGSRYLFLEFWDPHISGTVQARNFKFGMQIQYEGLLQKKIRIRSKGSRRDDVTFAIPLHISRTICSAMNVV